MTDHPSDTDVFTKVFSTLKRRNPPADFTSVIDPQINSDKINTVEVEGCSLDGLNPPNEWHVHQLTRFPGLYIVRNALTQPIIRYLIKRCLADYPAKPHVCNLDAHSGREDGDIWRDSTSPEASEKDKGTLKRLRWVTLGYHYDWTKKIYKKDLHHPFPEDLSLLSRYIISCVLGKDLYYQAEAAIVNFYHRDSRFSGHTDHSEFDLQAPVISISLGLPCIFMLGGQNKSVKPEAVFLRSGDIIIMSGDERMSYHAVPRILENGIPEPSNQQFGSKEDIVTQENTTPNLTSDDIQESSSPKRIKLHCQCQGMCEWSADQPWTKFTIPDWHLYEKYLKNSRININARQMFHEGKGPNDYIWPTMDPEKLSKIS